MSQQTQIFYLLQYDNVCRLGQINFVEYWFGKEQHIELMEARILLFVFVIEAN